MKNLVELQRQKAELKAKIELQQIELKNIFLEVRQEVEPAFLLKKAVTGMFSFSQNKPKDPQTNEILQQLPAPLRVLIDLLVKDSRWALLIKLLAPVAMNLLPSKAEEPTSEEHPEAPPKTALKSKLYGNLRRGVAKLRSSLHKKPIADTTTPEPLPETTENK